MSLPYFYEPHIQIPVHILSEETSKHCIQVMRMKPGEQLQITNGKGELFTATIINADKKRCQVNLEDAFSGKSITGDLQTTRAKISIAMSLLKNPSRFEWFLEKAAEIGVSEITPLICEHTEKENFRFERMNNILISAMLQSRQTRLCDLHQPEKFNRLITQPYDGLKFIAHCADGKKQSLVEAVHKKDHTLVLIGPEGDFSATEVEAAIERNFVAVSLGNTRLRSETAGIVASALLSGILL